MRIRVSEANGVVLVRMPYGYLLPARETWTNPVYGTHRSWHLYPDPITVNGNRVRGFGLGWRSIHEN